MALILGADTELKRYSGVPSKRAILLAAELLVQLCESGKHLRNSEVGGMGQRLKKCSSLFRGGWTLPGGCLKQDLHVFCMYHTSTAPTCA
jgi:hypothetical protein